ncbi:uncharacterized protein KY384_008631 [Bacidia gigantensis]|uniref:uncharacterized protein n=1 Tax=Bacidia gigantensis TaxID=2732470 RepID=UPI001D042C8C|nr:uncharacterized protein KY384_008631 [Bacidia gigantensis]KAG8527201.1 hypothetical protein KY384_008631 [Bacidia gigantensis]
MVSSAYLTHAASAVSALQQWYNQTTGLWDSTGWWNSANCLTVVADYASLDPAYVPQAVDVFQNTLIAAQRTNVQSAKVYSPKRLELLGNLTGRGQGQPHQPRQDSNLFMLGPTSQSSPGFLNDFYDDEGWWALAWIRAYDVTQDPTYLSTAESIFEDMIKGWGNNSCEGGLWWDKGQNYINAIANELFLSVAAHLVNRVDDPNKKYQYLNWALKEWSWFQGTQMINSNSRINDGIDNVTCLNNHGIVWSYNQGVILGGLVELSKASPNPSYLSTAASIANAAISWLCDAQGILHDPCEPSCVGDGEQFKGIFMRNLYYLWEANPQDLYLQTIKKNADSIWANDRDIYSGHFGQVWSGPYTECTAGGHASATDAIIAAAKIDNHTRGAG